MILILVFAAFFAYGWVKARRAGGDVADRLRYGFVHGIAATLLVFAVVTLGDWFGWF